MKKRINLFFKRAEKEGKAIGHFNFSTLELLRGILLGSARVGEPVFIATSEGERAFVGGEQAVALFRSFQRGFKNAVLHADHHHTYESAKQAIDQGYPSVHIDASHLSFEENVKVTRKVVRYAEKREVWVEGELGHVAGSSTLHRESINKAALPELMTKPEQAKEFVELTGVDSLAVNVGNAHGIWEGAPRIDFERIRVIKRLVKKPLVLHGGSGIPPASLKKAVAAGICKVNINSEVRLLYASELEKALKEKKDYTPYHYMQGPVKAVARKVALKIKSFHSSN